MAATVDALLPLSFLEAVRAVDRPAEDPDDTEFVPELLNKRFGLSETVYAQIRRYAEAVRRRERQRHDEVVALAKLIGRRPDAEAIFRDAGRFLAQQAVETLPATSRRMAHALPGLLARPVALRQVRRAARRYLDGSVTRVGSSLLLEVEAPVTQDSAPRSAGCAYYESSFGELLRLIVDGESAVQHVRCASRAEGRCQWRADWKR
jgi:bacteriochlorophyll 4-vinyl reductase